MDKNMIYLLLVVGAIALFFLKGSIFGSGNVKNVNSTELKELMKQGKVELIDVRTAGEVSGGYIKGTKTFIDYMSSDFKTKVAKLDKSKQYVIYCASGRRSVGAYNAMSAAGFTNLLNLSGGFGSWDGEVTRK